jgi:hypothetical protein
MNQTQQDLANIDRVQVGTAGLDAMQSARFIANRGAAAAGYGLGKAAVNSGLFGEQAIDPRLRAAQATEAILKQMQQEGIDPSDPIKVKKELAMRLGQAGLVREATQLAQQVQMEEMDIATKRATIAKNQAATLKDLNDVKNAQTPIQKIIATGKFTPESVATYRISEDPADLVLHDPDRYGVVETAEGVELFNKADPTDRVRVGAPKPSGSNASMANRQEFDKAVRAAWEKYGADGSPAEVVFERMRRADGPGFAQLMAIGKEAVGADNVMQALGSSKPLTVEQGQLFDYGSAALLANDIVARKQWGTPANPFPKIDDEFIKNLQVSVAKNPNAPMTMDMILAKIGDRKTREYLADYFGALLPVLRKDTGAAIAGSEWINYFNTYVPSGNASAEDNASRVERLQGRIDALQVAIESDPNMKRRMDNLKALQEKRMTGRDLLSQGRAAKAKSPEAYRAWFTGLSPEQQKIVREEIAKLRKN